jgi:hypothetical protein
MMDLLLEAVCNTMKRSSLRAQTERRDDAGPVSLLLGGKGSPAALVDAASL